MARTVDLSRYSADDLAYALRELIAQRKATSADVHALASRRGRIAELERELEALKGGRILLPSGATGGGGSAPKRKRVVTMTPKMRAARKRQGLYISLLRKLAGKERSDVRKLAQSEGVAKAIDAAKKLVA